MPIHKIVLGLAFIVFVAGCGNAKSSENSSAKHVKPVKSTIPEIQQVKLSPTQERFIKTRGNPQAFIVAFFKNGSRRLESWIYTKPAPSVSTFDSGFFVSERKAGGTVTLPDPGVLPQAITPDLTQDQVMSLFGTPDEDTQVMLGNSEIRVLRYFAKKDSVYKAFTFTEGKIVSATVGWAWRSP